MNLLAIDCACTMISTAVLKGDEIFYIEEDTETNHSCLAMNFIDSLMKKARLKPCEIDKVLCMGGPGSFTGLRTGYSIAKGLTLSLSIPFFPVSTLSCVAFPHKDKSFVIPVIKAGKNSFYFSVFRGTERITEDMDAEPFQIALEIEKLKTEKIIILTGPGAFSLFNSLPQKLRRFLILDEKKQGYAKELVLITREQNLLEKGADFLCGPEYIRKIDAELNLKELGIL